MYSYEWDKKTRGYRLTTQSGKFVAAEIRPVFAEELQMLGFDEKLAFDKDEKRPLMWARNNVYIYNGEEIIKLHKTQLGKPLEKEYLFDKKKKIQPIDLAGMIETNKKMIDALVANTLKRIKEMYDSFGEQVDLSYIAFSGGKDSVLLLDLCNQVLPVNVPVIYSDTTMDLPASYDVWQKIQLRYPERQFLCVRSEKDALENWKVFGPPSRSADWCCSVHKSTPVILSIKERLQKDSVKLLAFLGIRGDESLSRDGYDGDIGIGVKNASQINAMPIENWGSHELFLYYFEKNLLLNEAYKCGLPRVGCIFCPKASDKYAWFVEKKYPEQSKNYKHLIIDSSLKNFKNSTEENDYLAGSGWQARRNGLEIKGRIIQPAERHKGDFLTWQNANASRSVFFEWIKTLGQVEQIDSQEYIVKCGKSGLNGCYYEIAVEGTDEKIATIRARMNYDNTQQKKQLQAQLKKVVCKAVACVGCRVCEADCSFGALKFLNGRATVNSSKCVHCLKCHDIDYGCWRYKSMMVPTTSDTPLKSIANYQNFGLRQAWIEIYVEKREDFSKAKDEGLLGGPMVDSARIWFKQALLCKDSATMSPNKLLELATQYGADNGLLWSLIWIALSNNAPLIKWFVTNCDFDVSLTAEQIAEKMGDIIAESTKKGGWQALSNLFKSSPLGTESECSVVEMATKGARVLSLRRVSRSIEPLAVLYSLYLMGAVAERSSFTLSEMMTADLDSPYISPLVAFGMSVEELKGQCLGIAAIYPEYISCSFTLGLDEVKIFPQEKTLDDVLGLILGE